MLTSRTPLVHHALDTGQADAFRARQLQAIVDVVPWVALSNAINASVSLYFLLDVWPSVFAIAWFCAIVLVASAGLPLWWSTRRRPLQRASRRTAGRVIAHGIVLGLLWAAIPALAFHQSTANAQLFIVGMTVGMLCGGGFVLATLPSAAYSYVCVMSIGAIFGLWQTPLQVGIPLFASLIVYVCIIFAMTASLSRTFNARLTAEANAAQQQELVSLLLNDFQEHTSDWFWETDAQGKLCNVSSRLATVLDLPMARVEGFVFVALLVERCEESEEGGAVLDEIGRLQAALLSDKPFRNLQFSVKINGAWRRWQVSGKPIFDKQATLIGWRGVGSDVTATHEAHAEVRRLASTDEVTGLANRHEFKRALQRVGAEPAALFYLDLDNFKVINDVHGHAVGDLALGAVADVLRRATQPTDLLARIGGDEFAVLRFGSVDRRSLEADAKHMCEALTTPGTVGSLRLNFGTSIGVALAPDDAEGGESLLRCADLAVYEAKRAGRGTWRFFTHELGERAARRHLLQDDLREGLRLDQFSMRYQPQFDAHDGRLIGAEALVRWQHPTRGDISPTEIISVAEESGVMGMLGGWVLQRACEAAQRWPSQLRVAVNVSALQLVHPAWVKQVREVLDATGLAPSRLELELTETALIDNTAAAMSAIVRLRALGVRVALDDFGTGYSSLAYLRRFPFDKIKIDQSFVVGITRDPQALAIVTAVARLASALELEITAEGVENDEQTRLLRQLGCTSLQGFLFARPMTEDTMRQYVATEHLVPGLSGVAIRRIDSNTGERVA